MFVGTMVNNALFSSSGICMTHAALVPLLGLFEFRSRSFFFSPAPVVLEMEGSVSSCAVSRKPNPNKAALMQ